MVETQENAPDKEEELSSPVHVFSRKEDSRMTGGEFPTPLSAYSKYARKCVSGLLELPDESMRDYEHNVAVRLLPEG